MKWVHIGEEIKYDWYELRCQLSQENHLQIFLEGLRIKNSNTVLILVRFFFADLLMRGGT